MKNKLEKFIMNYILAVFHNYHYSLKDRVFCPLYHAI